MRQEDSLANMIFKILIGVAVVIAVAVIGRLIMAAVIFSQVEKLQEIGLRPLHRMQAEQERKKLKAIEQAARERELMKGVHAAVARQNEETRMNNQFMPIKTQVAISTIDTEEIWKRWYKPLPGCDVVNNSNMMGCVNHHVREKRKFEVLMAEGKIQ